jgi:hypothetical protein
VSKWGPVIVQDHADAKKFLDKARISLIVLALDAAARATGNPAAKQSITNLADAYLRLKDAWSDATTPPIEAVLSDTSRLESVCKSQPVPRRG